MTGWLNGAVLAFTVRKSAATTMVSPHPPNNAAILDRADTTTAAQAATTTARSTSVTIGAIQFISAEGSELAGRSAHAGKREPLMSETSSAFPRALKWSPASGLPSPAAKASVTPNVIQTASRRRGRDITTTSR
jgi:hypothetical protein